MRLIATLAMLGLLSACVAVPPPGYAVNPNPPPPPPRAESIPPPPVSAEEMSWQPGHWDWDGQGGYAWREGLWIPRAGHGTQWLDGFWADQGGSWVWIPGHWV